MPVSFLINVETYNGYIKFTNLDDFIAFRDHMINQSPAYIASSLIREIREATAFELELSHSLNVPADHIKGICLLFGSVERTRLKTRSWIVRDLLRNPRTIFLVRISRITGDVFASIISARMALKIKYHINQIPYP